MEAQTDIQTYMDSGKQALAQGQGREAAIAYAHAAQLEPGNPMIHLGLAEANLALGSYGIVFQACKRVQELQPAGGFESTMAQALLNLLDRRYDRALQEVDRAITIDPGNGYAHALRAYLLRATGQGYDAGLANARAARLSYGGRYENSFPPIEPPVSPGYRGVPPIAPANPSQPVESSPAQREAIPTWSRPNAMQRQVVRTRFAISRHPRLVTNTLIAINVAVYIIMAFLSQSLDISQSVLSLFGAQDNPMIYTDPSGQFWRIFTAMFLHFSIFHIGLNMLSLFFIGTVVEVFYGKWRYLAIYLGSGIIGGIVTLFVTPQAFAAGASGAIFGVFGALGAFYIVNRRALGAFGQGAIVNWLFWLGLNLVFGFSQPGIGIWDHIGGLIAGMLLGVVLMPRSRRRML